MVHRTTSLLLWRYLRVFRNSSPAILSPKSLHSSLTICHRTVRDLKTSPHSCVSIADSRSIVSTTKAYITPAFALNSESVTFRMTSSQKLDLPDLIALCRFPCSVNPYCEQAGGESVAWINRYDVFRDSKRSMFMQLRGNMIV